MEKFKLEADLQRFKDAAILHDVRRVNFAITGYLSDVEPSDTRIHQPAETQLERPLTSVATLNTSLDSDYICLAPCVTKKKKEARLLRVHRQILCKASPYFQSLLNSNFSEASIVLQTLHTASSSGSPATGSRDQKPNSKRARIRLSKSSGIPVIGMLDLNYEELQMLLFYIYTDVAILEEHHLVLQDRVILSCADVNDHEPEDDSFEISWSRKLLPAVNAFDMYRVADMYGVDDLRAAALRHIRTRILSSWLEYDLKVYE
ncbi:hypothetical protein NDA12_000425 [Ustilago hordei]|nr:hypothetical protein NDA15_002132 [Ustilago hordei]KAJ1580495.1 hypothetical protein NDA12_000425 [Ustilago hordei]